MKTLYTTVLIFGPVATLIGQNREGAPVSLTSFNFLNWSQVGK